MNASDRLLPSSAALLLIAAHAFAAPLNEAARVELLLPRGAAADRSVKERVARGQNFQALVTIPGARHAGGPLLDPDSVRVEWGGEAVPHFVYCKAPDLAIVFARLEPQQVRIRPEAELSMSVGLLGREGVAAGWRLPIAFAPEEVERAEAAAIEGRTIEFLLAEDTPARGAEIFGQRREDVWAPVGDAGTVVLDAMTRNSAGPHYARGAAYWTVPFDPVTSQTVTLTPRRSDAMLSPVKATLAGADGKPVEEALLWINESYHAPYSAKQRKPILVPRAGCEVLVIAAGFAPRRTTSAELSSEQAITLSPLPDQPPAR